MRINNISSGNTNYELTVISVTSKPIVPVVFPKNVKHLIMKALC